MKRFDGRTMVKRVIPGCRAQSLYIVAQHDRNQIGTTPEQPPRQCNRRVHHHFRQLVAAGKCRGSQVRDARPQRHRLELRATIKC